MPNLAPDGYIELGRTFADFEEGADLEQAAYDNYFTPFFGGGITWDQLLESRCTVILAEAGSGKTWEMRARAAELIDARRTAFFVRLEQLARSPLEEAFSPDDKRRFQSWREGSAQAVFLLARIIHGAP